MCNSEQSAAGSSPQWVDPCSPYSPHPGVAGAAGSAGNAGIAGIGGIVGKAGAAGAAGPSEPCARTPPTDNSNKTWATLAPTIDIAVRIFLDIPSHRYR